MAEIFGKGLLTNGVFIKDRTSDCYSAGLICLVPTLKEGYFRRLRTYGIVKLVLASLTVTG